jgi:hypothetical protein
LGSYHELDSGHMAISLVISGATFWTATPQLGGGQGSFPENKQKYVFEFSVLVTF